MGSGSYEHIYRKVRVPEGRVTTYGRIATKAGTIARAVGGAMRVAAEDGRNDVKWWRVIDSRGYIRAPGKTGERQQKLLKQEGVEVAPVAGGEPFPWRVVNFKRFL